MMKGRHKKIRVPVGAAGSCALGQVDGAAGKTKAAYIMEDRPSLGNQEKAGNGNHTIIIAKYWKKCKKKVVVFWSGSRWKSMPA